MSRIAAVLTAVAAAAAVVIASPAGADCTPGPQDSPDDTVHFVNPVTSGRQYVDVDPDQGKVKAGTTNAAGSPYIEAHADKNGNVDLYIDYAPAGQTPLGVENSHTTVRGTDVTNSPC